MVQEYQAAKQTGQEPAESERTKNIKIFKPKVDIYETQDAMVLIADVPGVDENSVEVILDKNVLKIHGTIEQSEEEKRRIFYAEYDIGDYQRTFTLSEEVDRENIEATVKNGVLRLVLHKAEPVKAKKIAIKAG
jgi:HSP20 family molecular chaperone IbpA